MTGPEGYFWRPPAGPEALKRSLLVFAGAAAAAVAVRVLLVLWPGAPATDVYYYDAQAVSAIIHGMDPYGHVYSVPPSLATPGAAAVFAYLPGVFSFLLPAGAVADVRAGLVAADLVAAAGLYAVGGRRGRLCAVAFLLAPPTVLFSTWFPDNSLPAVAFLSAAVALEARGKSAVAPLFWGLSAASWQLAWLLFPLYLVRSLRLGRLRDAALFVLAGTAALLPFLLWDASAFVYDTVVFQFGRAAVGLVSTGPFGLSVNPSLAGAAVSLGVSLPAAARGVVEVAALLACLRMVKGTLPSLLLASAVLLTLSAVILPEEAFWSYFELPSFAALAWFSLRGAPERAGPPPVSPPNA